MNLVLHSIHSKGRWAFVRRLGSIVSRFGVTTTKTDEHLRAYLATLRDFGCTATFPITAVVLQRHPHLIRRLADEGVEFAVHGYVHTDHALLSEAEQRVQMRRALDVFRACGVSAEGFRGPYLRYNLATVAAARSLGFRYVSNETICYDVLDRAAVPRARWGEYQRALTLYSALPAARALARPRMLGDLVEIPVAMPDDEILLDRLGFDVGEQMARIWESLVNTTYATGDLLTLQLHPERGEACREALAVALATARQKPRPVWMAQLREIAAWWRRRAAFTLNVESAGPSRWRVVGPADPDAVVLLKGLTAPGARPAHREYAAVVGREIVVESARPPVIGVPTAAEPLRKLLEEEGYVVWPREDSRDCALFVNRPGPLGLAEQATILREVETASAPLARLARWPRGAPSALAITGDIDALTLGDFLRRAWEVR
ncbi:MAG TPA: polysaccharide deacetylase family protein [Chloroflexota bacterium]|nr:polysaccharide deacetylase family protein [Chloroflexota bacterium]